MEQLPDRLREARHRLGLTQSELAQKMNIPYRTIQDGEQGKSTPGTIVLQGYGGLGVDLNWLLMGRSIEVTASPPQKLLKIEGKRFRVRSTKLVRIPYYDPYSPESFDPDNPECAIAINPSKLTAYNLDYIIQDVEWATIASTTVITADAHYAKGTLVLFDTDITKTIPGRSYIVSSKRNLNIQTAQLQEEALDTFGQVVYALTN